MRELCRVPHVAHTRVTRLLPPFVRCCADPFVSQTVFQGFSCRQLDENEEWLDVDFQISCTSDSYFAFVSLGFVGVLVYPLGLPTCALLLLFKNSGEIKSGGAAYERYEFLVAGDIDAPSEPSCIHICTVRDTTCGVISYSQTTSPPTTGGTASRCSARLSSLASW
eukprot:COSAG03_NODE_2645_length_2565_cov_4.138281_2_plen_166_part_00